MDVIGWCFKRQRYRTSLLFLKIARARGSRAPTTEPLRSCAVLAVGYSSGFVPTPIFSKADIREHMAGPTRINFTIRFLLVCIVFHTKTIQIVKLGPCEINYNLIFAKSNQLYDSVGFKQMSHGLAPGANRKVDVPLLASSSAGPPWKKIRPP